MLLLGMRQTQTTTPQEDTTMRKKFICERCGKDAVDLREYVGGDKAYIHKVVRETTHGLTISTVKDHCFIRKDNAAPGGQGE